MEAVNGSIDLLDRNQNNNCIFQTFTLYKERTRKNPRNRKEIYLGYTKQNVWKIPNEEKKKKEKCIYVALAVCMTSRGKEKKEKKDI